LEAVGGFGVAEAYQAQAFVAVGGARGDVDAVGGMVEERGQEVDEFVVGASVLGGLAQAYAKASAPRVVAGQGIALGATGLHLDVDEGVGAVGVQAVEDLVGRQGSASLGGFMRR
jgi:hypothetical protein